MCLWIMVLGQEFVCTEIWRKRFQNKKVLTNEGLSLVWAVSQGLCCNATIISSLLVDVLFSVHASNFNGRFCSNPWSVVPDTNSFPTNIPLYRGQSNYFFCGLSPMFTHWVLIFCVICVCVCVCVCVYVGGCAYVHNDIPFKLVWLRSNHLPS